MKAYFPEGVFELPPGWNDATVNVYQYATSGGRVSVVRAREEASVPFDAYCQHIKSLLAKNLPSCKILSDQYLEKDGLRAYRMELTWRKDKEDLHQIQIVLEHGNSFVVFTLVAPISERGMIQAFEQQMMSTARFRPPLGA